MVLSDKLKDTLNKMSLIELIEVKKEFEREPMYIDCGEIWYDRHSALNSYLDSLIYALKIAIMENINYEE